MKRKEFLSFLVFVAVSLFAIGAFAEEATGVAETGVPRMVYYQAFNFFALIAILVYFLKSKVGPFFKKRHDDVVEALKEANRIKTEAENKHQEYVIKIQELQREQDSVLEQMRRDGEDSRKRIMEEAKRISENIKLEARRAAETEMEKARAELYDEVLQQALEGARTLLVKSVAENDQRRLQKEFVEKIEVVQ